METTTTNQLQPFTASLPAIKSIEKKLAAIGLITTQEQAVKANSVLREAKDMVDLVVEDRMKLTRPLDEKKSEIMDRQKFVLTELSKLIPLVNAAVLTFSKEVERKRLEDLARIEKEKNESIAALETLAANGVKEIEGADLMNIELKAQVQSSVVAAPSNVMRKWKYEIADTHAIPREYLTIDEKKVKEAIALGVHNIPGLRIYQDIINVAR